MVARAVARSVARPVMRGPVRLGWASTAWPAESFTVGTASPATGTNASAGTWLLGGRPMPRTGTLTSISIYSGASATVKIKVLSRSGATFTLVREASISVVSGLNTVSLSLAVTAGDYIAVYSGTVGFMKYNSLAAGAVSGTEYYYTATEVTTAYAVSAAALPTFATRLEVGFTLDVASATKAASVGSLVYLGPASPAAGSTPNVTTSQSYIDDQAFIFNGRLESITLHSTAAGLVLFEVLEKVSSGFNLYRNFSMPVSSGTATYTAGVDFPIDVLIPNDGLIGFWAFDTSLSSSQSGARTFRVLDAASASGAYPASPTTSFSADMTTNNPQVRFAIRPTETITPPTDRIDQTFTVLPPWFTSTGWSVVSSKLRNSGTGLTNATTFRRGGYYNGTYSLWVTFSGGTDEVAIFRKGGSLGTIATINVGTGLIAFRNAWDSSTTLPAVNTSKTCGFSISTGVEYKIDLLKTETDVSVTITDTTNGANTDTLSHAGNTGTGALSTAVGFALGDPGFCAVAGTIDVSRLKLTPSVQSPSVYFLGDSITQSSGATTYSNGYAQRIIAALGGSGLVSAHSGNTSSNIVSRIEKEIRQFMPQHVVVLIGTNDTVTATWQSNIDLIVERIQAIGATPWLGAVPPEASDANPELVMNPYLRTNYPSMVLSFDYALTTGGTGLGADLDASLKYDSLHPNDAGHLALKNQAMTDAPSLFAV